MFLEADVLAIQDLIQDLSQLCECYEQLHSLMEHEHKAIANSSLVTIEKLIDEKISLGNAIVTWGDSFAKVYESLLTSLRQRHIISNSKISIKDFAEFIYNDPTIMNAKKDLLAGVMVHEWEKLAYTYRRLETLRQTCNPKIEMNQYLIRKLLHHHRETFRFWQTIAIESASTYGAQGTAKNQPSNATIVIRT